MGLATNIATLNLGDDYICQPAQKPGDARPNAVAWGANLSVSAGDVIAVKTADSLCYPAVVGGTGGLGVGVGFSMYTFQTDASGRVFFGSGGTNESWGNTPFTTAPIWESGTFFPAQLKISGSSSAATVANLQTLFSYSNGASLRKLANGAVELAG